MTEPTGSIAASLDRRRILQVAGAAGLAGVLAACNGGTANSSAGPPDDPPDAEDTAPDEPDDTDGDDGEADALASTGEVPVGGGVIVAGAGVVITQPAAGEFRGFSSTCTHQGCTVSSISDGIISCPCHGSQYSVEDGSVQRGPAVAGLPEVEITVDGDQILRG